MSYVGEIYALLTAVFWALAVIFFRVSGAKASPMSLNLFKNTVGFLLLILTLFFIGSIPHTPTRVQDTIIFSLSGVLGVAIADNLFFQSLRILGASSTAILECLYSPSVVFFAFLLLGETMTGLQVMGGILIVSSFFLLMNQRERMRIPLPLLLKGLFLGALSMIFMALSIVAIKPLFPSYSILWITTVRMGSGVLAVILFSLLHRKRKEIWSIFQPQEVWKHLIPGSVLGSYLAILCWIGGFKYMQANLASLLNQLSTVLVVIMASLFLKEAFTRPKGIAVVLALIGSVMVIY